jgi:predicted lipoprotein with Yx(FWY)xxD motif
MNAFRCTAALSVTALALALSACGSSDDTTTAAPSGNTASGDETVSTASVDGVGTVLVDASGNALYSPDEESNGKIQCTGECEQIWMPLAASGTPTASADVTGELGTVKRPDGTEQVALDGAPLYTFAEDSPGQATGDGVQDSFGGNDFTWHAVTADGTAVQGGETTPSDAPTGGGGYDY